MKKTRRYKSVYKAGFTLKRAPLRARQLITRKFNKCIFYGLSLGLLSISLSIGLSNNTYADANNAAVITESIVVGGPEECNTLDITNSYAGFILDSSKWWQYSGMDQNYATSFENALDNGNWTVVQNNQYLDDYYVVDVYWSEDNSAYLEFNNSHWGSDHVVIRGSGMKVVSIALGKQYDGALTCDPYIVNAQTAYDQTKVSSSNGSYKLFLSTAPVNYPENYAGPNIPESSGNDNGGVIVKPQFTLEVEKKAGRLAFRDADNTKEYVYAWTLLHMKDGNQIADNLENIVADGVNDPISEATFEVDEYGKYVLGVMMCPVGTLVTDATCEPIAGTGAVWLTLNINGQPIYIDTGDNPNESPHLGACTTEVINDMEVTHCGSLQDTLFSTCVQAEFPFMDFNQCLGNITKLFGLLSFNFAGIGGQFDATPCKQLGVVGDWLNKPGITVCPQVPESVRNVVTPFVTFALGLMMLAFITRQTREKF